MIKEKYEGIYINVIESFLERSINVLDFEKEFLNVWHENAKFLEGDVFDHIEDLFYSVEKFTHLPLVEGDDPDDYINEDQLRDSAAKTLQRLKSLK